MAEPQAGEPALLALPFETLSKVVAFMGPSRKAPLSTPSELLRTCRKLARLADDPTTRAQFLVATYGITNVLDGAGRWISLLTREVLGILLRRVGTAPRYQLQRLYQRFHDCGRLDLASKVLEHAMDKYPSPASSTRSATAEGVPAIVRGFNIRIHDDEAFFRLVSSTQLPADLAYLAAEGEGKPWHVQGNPVETALLTLKNKYLLQPDFSMAGSLPSVVRSRRASRESRTVGFEHLHGAHAALLQAVVANNVQAVKILLRYGVRAAPDHNCRMSRWISKTWSAKRTQGADPPSIRSLTNRFFGFEANTTNTVEVTRFTVLGHVATAIASAIASPWSYPTVVSEKLDRTCPLDVAVGGSQGPRAAMMRMILDALRAEGWLNTRAGHDSLKRCRQFCYEMSLAEALAIIGEYSANKDLLAALERQDVQESERLFSQGLKVEREDILRLLQNPDIMASHELMIKRCPMTLLTAKAALKHLAGASPRMRDRLLAQLLIEQDELRNGPDGQAWVASFFEDERLANLHFLARTFLPEAAAGVQVFPAVLSYDVAVAIKGKQYDVAKALLEMGAPRLQASDLARAMKDRQGTGMVLAALTTCDSYLRHDLTVVLQSAIANRRVQVYNLLLALDRATHPLISPEIMRIPIKSNVGADQSDLFRKCLEVAQREPKIANAWGQTRKMAHKKGGAFEDPFRAYLARYGKH